MFGLDVYLLWFIAGVGFICFEIIITGIGALFLGLASIITGILIMVDIVSAISIEMQFAICFGLTFILAVLLWKPLKKFTLGKRTDYLSDIVGSKATIIEKDLSPDNIGKIRWSGTILNARLDDEELENVKLNEEVVITEVRGTTCKVKKIRK
jgi:membrane protein implicated in regulation of membrane protease activity